MLKMDKIEIEKFYKWQNCLKRGQNGPKTLRKGKEKQQKDSKITNCVKSSLNRSNHIEKEVKMKKKLVFSELL